MESKSVIGFYLWLNGHAAAKETLNFEIEIDDLTEWMDFIWKSYGLSVSVSFLQIQL